MSRSTFIRALLALAALAMIVPLSALAAKPVERFHDNFRDTFTDVVCGIPVNGVAVGVDTFVLYDDDSFKDTSSVRVTLTNPANGKSVLISNAGQVTGTAIVDEEAGTVTFVDTFKGLPEQIRTPQGRVLLRDAGIAVFTEVFDLETGDLISSDVSFKGPHPDAESDFELFCEVITGAIG